MRNKVQATKRRRSELRSSSLDALARRREQEPTVSEEKRWVVEGTVFGKNWIEVIDASYRWKHAAIADMKDIAKRNPHLRLRVVEVMERREIVKHGGAKPTSDDSATKTP